MVILGGWVFLMSEVPFYEWRSDAVSRVVPPTGGARVDALCAEQGRRLSDRSGRQETETETETGGSTLRLEGGSALHS